MSKLNKALAILAALAFFLPFIAISCNGTVIPGMEVTGAKLAQCAVSTCTPKDFFNPKVGGMASQIPDANISTMPGNKAPDMDGINLVLFAALACLVAVLTLFLPGRAGELLSGVASVASIVLLFLFHSKLSDALAPQLNSPELARSGLTLQIQLQFSSGFWLSIVLSAASAILAFKGTSAAQASVSVGTMTGGMARRPYAASALACPSCAASNPAGNKFCLSCGGSISAPDEVAQTAGGSAAVFCSSCTAANPIGNKFCLSCGGPMSAPVHAVAPAQPSVAVAEAASESAAVSALPAPMAAAAAGVDPLGGDMSWMKAGPDMAAAAAAPAGQPLQATAPSVSDEPPASASAAATTEQPSAEQDRRPAPLPAQPEPVCTGCGAPVSSDAKFCRACGTPVRSAVAAVATSTFTPAPTAERYSATPEVQPFQQPAGSSGKMWIVVVLLLVVMGAAGWYVWKHFARPDVTITAFPQKIHVAAGGQTSLQASVSGSTDTDVDWSVQEGAKGGQITPLGAVMVSGQARASATYTAPRTSGTFHVIASSHANPDRTARVEVVVGGISQLENPLTEAQPAAPPVAANPAPAAYPNASQIVGTWRGPSSDMTTTIGADSTISMASQTDPQKNLSGTYRFTDNSHLDVDFGNGDVRKWEIVSVDNTYMRVTSQSKEGSSAMIFRRVQ